MIGGTVASLAAVTLWVGLAIAGDAAIRHSALHGGATPLALGTLAYALTIPVAYRTYRASSWGWVALAWSGMAVIASVAVACLAYREPLTWRRVVSLVLCVAAIGLAE